MDVLQVAAQEEAEAAAALARGKRSKLKRAKNKYGHQDEEDRQLALEVLAPAGVGRSTPGLRACLSALSLPARPLSVRWKGTSL